MVQTSTLGAEQKNCRPGVTDGCDANTSAPLMDDSSRFLTSSKSSRSRRFALAYLKRSREIRGAVRSRAFSSRGGSQLLLSLTEHAFRAEEEPLPHVEEFKHLVVLLLSGGRMKPAVDRSIGAASSVITASRRSLVQVLNSGLSIRYLQLCGSATQRTVHRTCSRTPEKPFEGCGFESHQSCILDVAD